MAPRIEIIETFELEHKEDEAWRQMQLHADENEHNEWDDLDLQLLMEEDRPRDENAYCPIRELHNHVAENYNINHTEGNCFNQLTELVSQRASSVTCSSLIGHLLLIFHSDEKAVALIIEMLGNEGEVIRNQGDGFDVRWQNRVRNFNPSDYREGARVRDMDYYDFVIMCMREE